MRWEIKVQVQIVDKWVEMKMKVEENRRKQKENKCWGKVSVYDTIYHSVLIQEWIDQLNRKKEPRQHKKQIWYIILPRNIWAKSTLEINTWLL